MDTAIPASEIKAKRRKTIFIILAVVLLLLAGLWFFRSGLRTSVKSSEIATAVAEIGSIENTLTASGRDHTRI
jgi:HlyD family secretion protein